MRAFPTTKGIETSGHRSGTGGICLGTPSGESAPATRRRGRPYRLPEDPTPLTRVHGGVNQRIAWLLGVSRIHAADPDLAKRDCFIDALRERGLTADHSRMSRWESGRQLVPMKVIAAYEDVLGLATGQLTAVAEGIRRSLDPKSSPLEMLDANPMLVHLELDELFEAVLGGNATGESWIKLSTALTRYREVYLLPDTWTQISDLLVRELGRSTGLAYVLRFEAFRMMVRHTTSQRHVVKALGALVTDPETQFVLAPISLLQEVEEKQAGDLVLRLLAGGRGQLRMGASWAAAGKIARAHFERLDLDRLEAVALHMLRESRHNVHDIDALDIAAQLPEDSRERLMLAVKDTLTQPRLDLAIHHGELLPMETTRPLATRIAEKVQADTTASYAVEPDAMLQRLVREALFHVNHERRYQASVLLSVSPYRDALGEQLQRTVSRGEEVPAVRALHTMHQVASEAQRDTLLAWGLHETRMPVRVTALMTLGQVIGKLTADEEAELVAAMNAADIPPITRATMYVLGMAGAECLAELSRTGPDPAAAAWWLRIGPSISETRM